jgi:HD-like signal output (HDOD) protein
VIQALKTREESLERSIRFINSQPNLPAFADHMAALGKAMSSESTSLNLLTNLILKNVSVTTVVLRAANSVYYNHNGKPVLSVSRAVTMMGWDSIRNLAATVLVFEHFRNQSEKLKELAVLMLLTGNHARQIAIRSGMRGIEEAYLCGMFRNLGEMVIAAYLPDEYAKIRQAATEALLSEADACERILKFRYDDLARSLARNWKLPDAVVNCMEALNLSAPNQGQQDQLRIISAFSHALSNVVYRMSSAKSREALHALVKQYGAALPIRECDIPAILEAAVFETQDTLRAARLPMEWTDLSRQIAAATNLGRELAAERQVGSADPNILTNLTSEVRGILESEEDFDLNGVLMMILEAIYRGAGLDRALFCMVDEEGVRVEGRLGVGADVEILIEKFRFPISVQSGPIGAAMVRQEDTIVSGAEGIRHTRSIFMNVVGAPAYGILPLTVRGVCVGCLYFDSASSSFALDEPRRQALLRLRRLAVAALSRKRKAS